MKPWAIALAFYAGILMMMAPSIVIVAEKLSTSLEVRHESTE